MRSTEDILLINKFDLYDNIATLENHKGRLRAEMVINPYPRINWNFEVLGEESADSRIGRFTGEILGYNFALEDAHVLQSQWYGSLNFARGFAISGAASRAKNGSRENPCEFISFFLPNAKCIIEPMKGGLRKQEYDVFSSKDEKPNLETAFPRRVRSRAGWSCQLNNRWSIEFIISDEAEKWLKDSDAQGTLLSTRGQLTRTTDNDTGDNQIGTTGLGEISELLENLCQLLSFANGGYLGPVVIEARALKEEPIESMIYSAYRVTPIELLGTTWLTLQSNFCDYISCFQEFQRMLTTEPWNNLWELILIWYFQAIQPSFAQLRGKPWPIVANALAALLERLTFEILKELDGKNPRGGPEARAKMTLTRLGITESKFHYDDEAFVDIFFKVRNDATHPRELGGYTDEQMFLSIQYAIQWIEEIILWRLGYSGAYRNRLREGVFAFEEPRYILARRDSNWL